MVPVGGGSGVLAAGVAFWGLGHGRVGDELVAGDHLMLVLLARNGRGAVGGGGGALAFASDWRTATGDSTNAITDGGKWDLFGPGVHSAIVAGAPFDFPMPNILAIRHAGSWGRRHHGGLCGHSGPAREQVRHREPRAGGREAGQHRADHWCWNHWRPVAPRVMTTTDTTLGDGAGTPFGP